MHAHLSTHVGQQLEITLSDLDLESRIGKVLDDHSLEFYSRFLVVLVFWLLFVNVSSHTCGFAFASLLWTNSFAYQALLLTNP